jgi:hypothetical protein
MGEDRFCCHDSRYCRRAQSVILMAMVILASPSDWDSLRKVIEEAGFAVRSSTAPNNGLYSITVYGTNKQTEAALELLRELESSPLNGRLRFALQTRPNMKHQITIELMPAA